MLKNRTVILAISALTLVAIVLGLLFLEWPWEDTSTVKGEQSTSSAVDLGITYVPITSRLAVYSDLGISSGALITEVAPHSPAERAGIKAGDIIVSFNGSKVEEETPLLGMMMDCTADTIISLEVHSGMNTWMAEIAHVQK